MDHTIIFNHIPRTGGTSLRVILNKIYGEERVFFINSRDIPSSLKTFKSLDVDKRKSYKVISGHGANAYIGLVERPFVITILREPLSLFSSQYYYLRKSHNSNFLDEVKRLDSLEQYIAYAIGHAQDNMMTRLMDPTNNQLYELEKPPPVMDEVGDHILHNALTQLREYDAIIDLDDFDRGIYSLGKMLAWKRIPLYRPQNKSEWNSKVLEDDPSLKEKITHVLRYDLELYSLFRQNNHGIGRKTSKNSIGYAFFSLRQKIIKLIDRKL